MTGASGAGAELTCAIDCVEAAVGGGIGKGTDAIDCVELGAAARIPDGAEGVPESDTGRRRTVAGTVACDTGAAETASGTGTRAVERGFTEGGVGMPTAGTADAPTFGAGCVAGRRRTVIGRGDPGMTGVTGEGPPGWEKGVTFGGIAPWGS